MITHNDPFLEKKMRVLRFHGIERDAWKRYGKGGVPEYDIDEPGYKYNLTDMQAALGIAQLDRLAAFNERRASLAERYRQGLAEVGGIDLPGVPAYPHEHANHLFAVKVTAMDRGRFMEKLSEYNIGYGYHYPACHLLRYVKKRYGTVSLPETERASARILSLPLYPTCRTATWTTCAGRSGRSSKRRGKGTMSMDTGIPTFRSRW